MNQKSLVIGSQGQVGQELVNHLVHLYGSNQIVASDLKTPVKNSAIVFEQLDVTDQKLLKTIIQKHNITHVYHLAAMLSATGEKNPQLAWQVNMNGLIYLLELAKEGAYKQLFFPSSIAVYGNSSPKQQTPQETIIYPSNMYGITKYAGEMLCSYYHQKFGIDVRGIRFPGLIGYKSLPGGGTTDYAVDIFHQAVKTKTFNCFLSQDTTLPMMYISDAIRAVIELMQSDSEKLVKGKGYNIAAMSFSPKQLAEAIKQHIPEFTITYTPDYRQEIASSWPSSISDQDARDEWDWKNEYDLELMTKEMLVNIGSNYRS